MIYCIDIDGVIAETQETDYEHSKPVYLVINKINSLYEQGHTIKIFTARGSKTGMDWKELTEKQLAEWGVRYHELIFGKPFANVYIDDKALNVEDWLKILQSIERAENGIFIEFAGS